MKKNGYLFLSLALFLILSQIIIFVVDKENWFDVSFTLETVHTMRIDGPQSISFQNYDVHPPTSYYAFYLWSFLNPGLSEYHLAQELSVLFMLGFLYFAYLCLRKLFGSSGEKATVLLALCTTYIHFGTEVRMYSMLFFLSAVVFWCILNEFKGLLGVVGIISIGLMPLIQYYSGAVAVVFFSGFAFIFSKKRLMGRGNEKKEV